MAAHFVCFRLRNCELDRVACLSFAECNSALHEGTYLFGTRTVTVAWLLGRTPQEGHNGPVDVTTAVTQRVLSDLAWRV